MTEEKKVLTPKEVAEYLGIGLAKAYALFRSKGFPALRLGKIMRVTKTALDNWIQNNSTGGVYNV